MNGEYKHFNIIKELRGLDLIIENLDNLIFKIREMEPEEGEEYNNIEDVKLARFLNEFPEIIKVKCEAIQDRIKDIKNVLLNEKF